MPTMLAGLPLIESKIYDAMAEAIRSGKPYQTRLDPPPADPRLGHPPMPGPKGARS